MVQNLVTLVPDMKSMWQSESAKIHMKLGDPLSKTTTLEVTKGRLVLSVIEAVLTRDTEFWGKMDPYVEIILNNQVKYTEVKRSAGKLPKWNQKFWLDVDNKYEKCKVAVYDKDPLKSDLIGETNINLTALISDEYEDEWFPLQF